MTVEGVLQFPSLSSVFWMSAGWQRAVMSFFEKADVLHLRKMTCLWTRYAGFFSHYEVHGDPVHSPLPASRSLPTTGIPFAFMHRPSPSALTDTPRPSAGTPRASNLFPARSFQRAIHIAKIVNDKLSTSKTVIIRFLEAEANVEGITQKVKDALGCDEVITLTDSQGNEIVDSEGTRSSHYWKQNSRKIYAIFEDDFVEFQNGRTAKAR
ncbi:uncharacterized protein LOC115778100 isoform X2 [Archocentrus centrarchus]|uniref:uncharacterized protein LOC115778100 isoform X2 n=1 Tax=Archocentrus centrarchus TaxID=63155 RepID=UPI0011EA0D83|nr:uncharacterized protein LOC115778100 isoform X2 [Archocentrus centrarchus]